MNDIRSLLRIAAQRLELTAFSQHLHLVAVALAGLTLALALADRAPGASFLAWAWLAPALAAGGALLAFFLWSRGRLSEVQVAMSVDERLDLRERLSTAVHCSGRDDPFAQTAVEDAVNTARDPRARETVKRRFVVTPPNRWWISPLLIIMTVVVLQLPQANLFAREGPVDEDLVNKARLDARESLEVVVRAVEDKPQLREELADFVDELGATPDLASDLDRPEQVKRDALKKVSELNRRLDDIVNGEKGKTAEALESMLSKLETSETGPGKELAEALAKGDFAAAKKALENIQAAAENGELNEEQKAKLAEAMGDLAQQLDKLAQQQEALENALKQAGLDPQLANNPQALQEALKAAENLNEQQKQQIQQMIQAQEAAQQMCQGMGGACQGMAQGLRDGKIGQAGQQMAGQLDQMEQLQQLLQQAQAAAGQCQGQSRGLGQGMNMNQAMQEWMQGGGMGNRGQGSGGKAPISPTPSGTKMTKADAPLVEGEIIASMLIDGVPVTGESRAKLKKVVAAAAEGYDEAITEDPLPRRYHEAQKHYFGELQEQVEAVTSRVETGEGAGEGAAEGDGEDAGEGGTANDAEP